MDTKEIGISSSRTKVGSTLQREDDESFFRPDEDKRAARSRCCEIRQWTRERRREFRGPRGLKLTGELISLSQQCRFQN